MKTGEISQMEISRENYMIAEDLRLVAENLKEKYPDLASEAMETCDYYLSQAEGK